MRGYIWPFNVIRLSDSSVKSRRYKSWWYTPCKSITHALLIPVYQRADFRPKQVVVSHLHDAVAKFLTRVKFSLWYNTRDEHDILWWYHVNQYRATRGNQSELAPVRKLPQCHVNVVAQFYPWFKFYFPLFWGTVMFDNEIEIKENKI